MKIAIISRNDIYDIRSWSGTDNNLFRALKKAVSLRGGSLCVVDKLTKKRNILVRIFYTYSRKLLLKLFRYIFVDDFYRVFVKYYARQIKRELPNDVDIIFSMTSWPITYLKSDKIKVFYSDADIGDFLESSDFKKLSKYRKKSAIRMRGDAINNSDLVLLASEWAVNGTLNRYNISDVGKVKLVPFGANTECNRTKEDIAKIIKNKEKEKCNLLFIGVDWDRKGGNIALETAKILHKNGMNVYLDIVGIKNCPVELPEYVINHGFISKSTENGRRKIDSLYEKAHFFILPTRFDCYGIVFCEASSFGLPSLAPRTGGVSSVILDGKNGKLFDLVEGGEVYAEYIRAMFIDYENYKRLCFSSFEQYETRLNWGVAAEKILDSIWEVYSKK